MASIAVVTDSTADFAGVDPAGLGVTVVPLTVHWGRDVLRDRVDLNTSEFYDRLRTDPNHPQTAAPPVGIFEEVYRDCLARADAVISIHLASSLSSTFNVAVSAAQSVDSSRIHVVDSTSTSVGLGWLVQRAAEMACADRDCAPILQTIEDMIPRLRLFLTLDTLEYLQRGGRLGRAQAFVGSLLNVKPVLQVLGGAVEPIERVRTRPTSIGRVGEIAEACGPKEAIAIVHGDCAVEALGLRDHLATRHPELPVSIAEVGAVIATYAGPGIIGVGCILAS